jgi:hypothetical protein
VLRSISWLSGMSRQTMGRWKKWTLSSPWTSRAASWRSRRSSRGIRGAPHPPHAPRRPAVTEIAPGCLRGEGRAWGRARGGVIPRAALASMSSTECGEAKCGPSSPCMAPAPGQDLPPEGGALESRSAPARRARPGGCADPLLGQGAVAGPPGIPGRMGRRFSARGAARSGVAGGRAPRARALGGAEGGVEVGSRLVGHSLTRSDLGSYIGRKLASAGTRVPAISIS